LSESHSEAEIYHASDEDNYPELVAIENEKSDTDIEHVINHDEEFDSDESNEDESIDIVSRTGKDDTQYMYHFLKLKQVLLLFCAKNLDHQVPLHYLQQNRYSNLS
jgi:hypothetical protein